MKKELIILTDYLLPILKPSEQAIVIQLFSRTIADDKEYCEISQTDLVRLTNMNILTIKKALANLIKNGFVIVSHNGSANTTRKYKLNLPYNFPKTYKIQRTPFVEYNLNNPANTLYELTSEGKEVLNVIKNSLSASEMRDIYLIAEEKKVYFENVSIENLIDAIIIERYFSEEKQKKYCIKTKEV